MSERDDDPIPRHDPTPQAIAPPTDAEIRARQRARATVMAWLLGGFVLLVFAISIVKIRLGYG